MTEPENVGGESEVIVSMTTALIAAAVLAVLSVQAITSTRPPFVTVFVFAAFVVWASNVRVKALQQDIGVSPALMPVMAAVVAFANRGGVLAAALVGFSGGLIWRALTNPRRTRRDNLVVTAFNCGQLSLAAAGAAVVYHVVNSTIQQSLVAAAGAAGIYAAVNAVLMLAVSVSDGAPASEVWAEMRPALPNFVAFGIIGGLVGQLYSWLGLMALVLLIVPTLIARKTYQSTIELEEAHAQTIGVFLRAMEAKDLYTARHTERVAKYAAYIGEELGWRGPRLVHVRQAALMHDIGKLAVSSQLLNKPGKLTNEEYAEIRRHNEVCVSILTQVEFLRSTIPVASDRHGFFDAAAARVDPTALEGYMVSVADAFDAMTSTRAYRKALPMDVAFEELRKGKGKQFHPECVEGLISAIERRGEHYGDGYEVDLVQFEVEPPVAGVGSAGLGDLEVPSAPVRTPTAPFRLA